MSMFFTKFRASSTDRNSFMVVGMRDSFVSALAFAFSAISLVIASQPAESDDEPEDRETVTLLAENAPRSSGL